MGSRIESETREDDASCILEEGWGRYGYPSMMEKDDHSTRDGMTGIGWLRGETWSERWCEITCFALHTSREGEN